MILESCDDVFDVGEKVVVLEVDVVMLRCCECLLLGVESWRKEIYTR